MGNLKLPDMAIDADMVRGMLGIGHSGRGLDYVPLWPFPLADSVKGSPAPADPGDVPASLREDLFP
ncbi:MAG: hypothetical protein R3E02_09950 [Blastomonas sp.]